MIVFTILLAAFNNFTSKVCNFCFIASKRSLSFFIIKITFSRFVLAILKPIFFCRLARITLWWSILCYPDKRVVKSRQEADCSCYIFFRNQHWWSSSTTAGASHQLFQECFSLVVQLIPGFYFPLLFVLVSVFPQWHVTNKLTYFYFFWISSSILFFKSIIQSSVSFDTWSVFIRNHVFVDVFLSHSN